MQLLSSIDHAPPVFTGPGYIRIPDRGDITYTIFATTDDPKSAVQSLAGSRNNPHDHMAQYRLQATDYQGVEWAGGWTHAELKGIPRVGYPLTGSLMGLSTRDSGINVSKDSSVELLFAPQPCVPLDKPMVTVSTIEEVEIERRIEDGKQTLSVLGSEITCGIMKSKQALWLAATTSDQLSHPYAERWLSEPFRVLLGQLIYPRLTARNFGDGKAMVQLMSVPRYSRQPTDISLLGEDVMEFRHKFWDLYKKLLALVATAKGKNGMPNFDVAHPVTRYYEEIIQATHGSLWVLCMTLSGAVEGLVRDIKQRRRLKIDTELKTFASSGVITDKQQEAWTNVRHDVMHGKLISPWPEDETEQRIRLLMELMRRLTHELLRVQAEKISLEK